MDSSNSINRTTLLEALPTVVKKNQARRGGAHFPLAKLGFSNSSTRSNLKSQNLLKLFGASESGKQIYARRSKQPLALAVANTEPNGIGTPLEPTSPEGVFLSSILQNKRHLFQFAVSGQLDELASDRETAAARKKQSSTSLDSLLHRRIAEMKETQCQNAVEDILYMSIVHKFSEVEAPMVPKLSRCISNNKVEIWPSKCRELESIHSVEIQEMIREHLAITLRMRGRSSAIDNSKTTKIDRLHLGKIYASSILYGYFLKAACLRRQLDLSLARSQENLGQGTYLSAAGLYHSGFDTPLMVTLSTEAHLTSLCQDTRHESLRSYVMGFDAESLQRCAKLKSKEAVNVIEKHTSALFEGYKIDQLDSKSDIDVTFPSLERLVLEAVAFGTFLWDVERSVDSLYRLNENYTN